MHFLLSRPRTHERMTIPVRNTQICLSGGDTRLDRILLAAIVFRLHILFLCAAYLAYTRGFTTLSAAAKVLRNVVRLYASMTFFCKMCRRIAHAELFISYPDE